MEFLAKPEEILRLVPAYGLHSLRMTAVGVFKEALASQTCRS